MQVNNINSNQTNFKALILPSNANLVKYAGKDAARRIKKIKPTLEEVAKDVDISIYAKARENNTTQFVITVFYKLINDFESFFNKVIACNSHRAKEIIPKRKQIFYKRMDIYMQENLNRNKEIECLISNTDINKKLIMQTKKAKIERGNLILKIISALILFSIKFG